MCILLVYTAQYTHCCVRISSFKPLAFTLRTTRFNIQKFYMALALR